MIIVGDFNSVLDTSQDYHSYLHVNNPKAREIVLEHMISYSRVDIYKEFLPYAKRYSWRKPTPLKQAHLDFFLISASLIKEVKNRDITISYISDRSPVFISLKFFDFTHGSGLWKTNNSLLKDLEF